MKTQRHVHKKRGFLSLKDFNKKLYFYSACHSKDKNATGTKDGSAEGLRGSPGSSKLRPVKVDTRVSGGESTDANDA